MRERARDSTRLDPFRPTNRYGAAAVAAELADNSGLSVYYRLALLPEGDIFICRGKEFQKLGGEQEKFVALGYHGL